MFLSVATTDDSHYYINRPATSEVYSLSLHDALPIFTTWLAVRMMGGLPYSSPPSPRRLPYGSKTSGACMCPSVILDRKSTRLNSSHVRISYAVFCLKKKKMHSRRDMVG